MKPQNLIPLSILIIFAIGFFAVPDVFADRTYTNEKYYFSLQYPDNWKVSELHLVDKASNYEIIVELTSPEYEAAGCINGQCDEGLWYGKDRILISRDILPGKPAFITEWQYGGMKSSLVHSANILFAGTWKEDGKVQPLGEGGMENNFVSVCNEMTFQSDGKICKNPKLMDAAWHSLGWSGYAGGSGINTVKIITTSTLEAKLNGGTLQYDPVFIIMSWYDSRVDKHNWQITAMLDDFRNSNGYGSNEKTSDIVYGITDSFTFDRPSDYSPPVATGGCLIATAAFGSEMAPQVQFLREIRDNTVLQTESGSAFMTGFNQFYYSFSPAIADYERENPAFKEAVKITLTPLLTSLTLLQYADIDSESEMLGYGIGVILLNIGMYFVAPAVLIMAVRKRI